MALRPRSGSRRGTWLIVLALLLAAHKVSAQTTTATITGRVLDDQGLALAGVSVTVQSANLQGRPSCSLRPSCWR
jgi:hypothetical protein